MALARLLINVEVLAERLGFELETWDEDGLGEAAGAMCRLPTGRVILLRQLHHMVDNFGVTGPDIHVDLAELVESGVHPLLAEVLEALGLSLSSVSWVQTEEGREEAAAILRRWRPTDKRNL